jgi:hypothetical protein
MTSYNIILILLSRYALFRSSVSDRIFSLLLTYYYYDSLLIKSDQFIRYSGGSENTEICEQERDVLSRGEVNYGPLSSDLHRSGLLYLTHTLAAGTTSEREGVASGGATAVCGVGAHV